MTIQQFLRSDVRHWSIRPKVICRDGFLMSVQASPNHASSRDLHGEWATVEVGFPIPRHHIPEAWDEYQHPDTPENIWCYVPVEKVQNLIDAHGGILVDG